MKKQKTIIEIYRRNSWIYLVILAMVIGLIFLGEPDYGFVALGIFVIVLVYTIYFVMHSHNQWERMVEDMRSQVEEGKVSSYLDMPLPILLVDHEGSILWHNSKFDAVYNRAGGIIGQSLDGLFPGRNWRTALSETNFYDQRLGDKNYRIFRSKAEGKTGDVYSLYWYDQSDYSDLKQQYMDEKPLVAYIQVDNYDEVMSNTPEDSIPFLISEMNSVIKQWASRHNGVLYWVDDEEYVMLMENHYLESMELKKFTVLDDIRKIDEGNRFPMTLSIGISVDGEDINERDTGSQKALELALGRGGDQAVIRKGGSYEFFGGRSKNVERKSRVKSRVVAQSLASLIKESDHVYIMGHHYPDMDSLASAIGVYRCCLNLEVPASIILDEPTEAITSLYDLFKDNKLYQFVAGKEVMGVRNHDKNLLIVVDTHRPNFTEAPEVIPLFTRRVVIDHHRRGTEMIENTSLLYQEPYASSVSEMISEILQYITSDVHLEPLEASALLSGIILDTKNFVFNTGVRTFDAASFLRRYGADTRLVRELFKEDLVGSVIKSNIITSVTMVTEGIAMAYSGEPSNNIKTIISQGADELIDIKGIHTSFVLGEDEEGTVFISARSTGKTNVQVILEKLGGGGHLETAGAQLEKTNLEDAKTLLLNTIEESLEE